ncbi:MAG: epoxyqueuosine reductase QueH [Bacillota bacterium]|nr:epoxyqueuosine reductase QueH [Bacillota bacterium]
MADVEKKKLSGCCLGEFESENPFVAGSIKGVKEEKPSVMLHSCCGPCSSSVIETLAGEFNITVFFYNPCITDEEEYKRRRQTQIDLIDALNQERLDPMAAVNRGVIHFMEGPYNPGSFLELCRGFENEPEGGARCSLCFRQRLEKTAEMAGMAGCDYFGTTLTVSPHKNYTVISEIGKEIALKYGLSFLDRDFKKKDGFRRSIELSKKYGLYRQNYCGCCYSVR